MHAAMMEGQQHAQPGQYRTVSVTVGGYRPPGPALVPSLMNELFSHLYKHEGTQITRAVWAHVQFETIHPFADGNGRTGRAVLQAALGVPIPISRFILRERATYYELFRKSDCPPGSSGSAGESSKNQGRDPQSGPLRRTPPRSHGTGSHGTGKSPSRARNPRTFPQSGQTETQPAPNVLSNPPDGEHASLVTNHTRGGQTMRTTITGITLTLCLLLAAACTGNEPTPPPDAAASTKQQETLTEELTETLAETQAASRRKHPQRNTRAKPNRHRSRTAVPRRKSRRRKIQPSRPSRCRGSGWPEARPTSSG